MQLLYQKCAINQYAQYHSYYKCIYQFNSVPWPIKLKMKKLANPSDIMSLSGKGFEFTRHQHNVSPFRNNLKQIRVLDQKQKQISPWGAKQQNKQHSASNKQHNVQHEFLSKIKFKNRRASVKVDQQVIKGKTPEPNNYSFTRQIPQQQIIVFPKSASTRHNHSNKQKQQLNHTIFLSTRSKWRDRKVKKSAVVSIDIDINNQESFEKMNPEKLLATTQTKNLNPFQRSQKKKELEKFKIRHSTRLKDHYQQQRNVSLKNYLKYLTQKPYVPQTNKYGKIRTSLRSKLSVTVNSEILDNRNTVDVDQLICTGQTICSPIQTRKDKLRKIIGSHKTQTVFLF